MKEEKIKEILKELARVGNMETADDMRSYLANRFHKEDYLDPVQNVYAAIVGVMTSEIEYVLDLMERNYD